MFISEYQDSKMNYSEIISRLTILEQQVAKLIPVIDSVGVQNVYGVELKGLTTVERTALGVKLGTLTGTHHILVYDSDDETFYTWSGTEWV